MAVYITGDCHGDFTRFSSDNFPRGKELTKEDYVIITGDMGLIWTKENKNERHWKDWLNDKPWTTLFIDGNHENFDRLLSDEFPTEEWNGGKVKRIAPNILYLMRGQVFEIEGRTLFTMGGAPSHDIEDGIIDPADYVDSEDMRDSIKRKEKQLGRYLRTRIKGISWWEQEEPSDEEWVAGWKNLEKRNYEVDFILTHECPSALTYFVSPFPPTEMSQKLEKFKEAVIYKHWYFGHYHVDHDINETDTCLYYEIRRIV